MRSLVIGSLTRVLLRIAIIASLLMVLTSLVESADLRSKNRQYPWIQQEAPQLFSASISDKIVRDNKGFSLAHLSFQKKFNIKNIVSLSTDRLKTQQYMLEWFRVGAGKESFISRPLGTLRLITKEQLLELSQVISKAVQNGPTLVYGDSLETLSAVIAAYRVSKGFDKSAEKSQLQQDILFGSLFKDETLSLLKGIISFLSFESFLEG